MGNLINKLVNKIFNFKFSKIKEIDNYDFDTLVNLGKLDNFHGNNKVYNITIGNKSYVSFNSIIYHTSIGSYCSIGPNVVIGYGDHPIDLISTSPHIYLNKELYTEEEIKSFLVPHFKKVIIEHDVWIGANVYIKNGVNIGTGAIIGAGAVVLKDVDNYEVVAGVPARIIKKRFEDEIITLLLKTKWWTLETSILKKYKDVLTNPTEISLKKMLSEIFNEE
ncbi:CatB-related O-acetyltransferase [Flavobacterium olei]|uniref:CatB-related O-acetyltransferase n=1 Tax=Flavobacterium olei TaxID=1886782 RepID=UPI003219A237